MEQLTAKLWVNFLVCGNIIKKYNLKNVAAKSLFDYFSLIEIIECSPPKHREEAFLVLKPPAENNWGWRNPPFTIKSFNS